MSDNTTKEDINNMNFETALKSLEEIVNQLDSGEIDLDKAVEAYERGTKLKEHCEKKLKDVYGGLGGEAPQKFFAIFRLCLRVFV